MQDVNLKQLLISYTNNLCDKQFVFTLPKDKKITVVFFRESLCYLMGLQHIFNYDTRYLGGKGYRKIQEESVTVEALKKHNKKQYGFINALNEKKSTYEDILRQRLDNLDKDYSLLKMQVQELIVRNNKSQISMPLAA